MELEIEARTEEEAIGKAFSWDSGYAQGWCEVGGYYSADDDCEQCHHDKREMYWEIVSVEPHDTEDVVELDAGVADQGEELLSEVEP